MKGYGGPGDSRVTFAGWVQRGRVRNTGRRSRSAIPTLTVSVFIFANLISVGFGQQLVADFSSSVGQGNQSLTVQFSDRSAPS